MILSNKEHWRFQGRDLVSARFKGRDVWPKSVTPELVRLTPAMTSNTTPEPFVCSAVSMAASGHAAAGAFDQVSDGTYSGWISSGGFNATTGVGSAWVQIYFGGMTRTLKEVRVRCRAISSSPLETGRSPRDFQLIALNSSGLETNVIATVTDSTRASGINYELLYTASFDVVVGGLKMLITKNWTNDTRVAVGEIELYGY